MSFPDTTCSLLAGVEPEWPEWPVRAAGAPPDGQRTSIVNLTACQVRQPAASQASSEPTSLSLPCIAGSFENETLSLITFTFSQIMTQSECVTDLQGR